MRRRASSMVTTSRASRIKVRMRRCYRGRPGRRDAAHLPPRQPGRRLRRIMKMPKASRFVGLALALVLPACAAKTKAPVAGADYLHGYVGQQRVLRFQGDQDKVAVKMKDRPQLPGACDTAVEVKGAVADKSGVRLSLETLGAASAE